MSAAITVLLITAFVVVLVSALVLGYLYWFRPGGPIKTWHYVAFMSVIVVLLAALAIANAIGGSAWPAVFQALAATGIGVHLYQEAWRGARETQRPPVAGTSSGARPVGGPRHPPPPSMGWQVGCGTAGN